MVIKLEGGGAGGGEGLNGLAISRGTFFAAPLYEFNYQ